MKRVINAVRHNFVFCFSRRRIERRTDQTLTLTELVRLSVNCVGPVIGENLIDGVIQAIEGNWVQEQLCECCRTLSVCSSVGGSLYLNPR